MSETQSPKTWGTREELLLACAVKRHGFKNWESVAMELQAKTSLPHLLTTAQCCKHKYQDLKRRFKDHHDHEHEQDDDDDDINNNTSCKHHLNIPWLDQLRKSRVDELKQQVQRHDLSILSLQLKVKKLEEERDQAASLDIAEQKPDLLHHNISATDKKDEPQKSSEEAQELCKCLVSGGESDRENRSVNESNSTGLSEKIIKKEEKGVGSGGGFGPVQSGWKAEVESEELGDSVTQLSSDVQSSASFGRKRKRSSSIKADVKSGPLVWLLTLIRTHKHASLFESRLKSQETSRYREVVRQHVDIETIQRGVEKGTYSSSSILTFYRDVLLLFNNAIVYFPKNSPESATAFQLRDLVSNEIKKETTHHLKSDSSLDPPLPPSSSLPPQPPKPTLLESSDSLLAKQKSSAPLIVCRKRSSVSAKQSPSLPPDHIHDKDKKPPPVERTTSTTGLPNLKTDDKAMTTGARSSRRSNRKPTPPTNIKQDSGSGSGSGSGSAPAASVDKQDTTPKADKKKTEVSDKKKSVVDFLKRIKKNSPVQTNKNTTKKGKGGGEEQQKRNSNSSSGKKDKGKERALWKNSSEKKQVKEENTNSPSKKTVGRPAKKTAEASGGKRGRESDGKEVVVVKRQSKRARR